MTNTASDHPPTATDAAEDTSHTACFIDSEFAGEGCDVLQNLGRYRATERSILKAIEACPLSRPNSPHCEKFQ